MAMFLRHGSAGNWTFKIGTPNKPLVCPESHRLFTDGSPVVVTAGQDQTKVFANHQLAMSPSHQREYQLVHAIT